jgi:hypothetical protein
MSSRICLLFLCLVGALPVAAWQLDSAYRIVIPAEPRDQSIGRTLAEKAKALQQVLAQHEIDVPVVAAEKPEAGKKSIFIGFPDEKKYDYFAGSIKIIDRDVYITGNDRHARGQEGPRNAVGGYYLGSIVSLVTFMQDYLDVRFVLPCSEGIVPGRTMPELPEHLECDIIPGLIFASGRHTELLYDYANANYGRGGIHSYGGHSHYAAIPQSLYAESHPEYFSLVQGRRLATDHYHGHCLSNLEVENLIYEEMLKRLDAGAETVELAQTDGNKPCECENCLKMPGGEDPGERLWFFHVKLAERLLQDRPGKKVLIICYWPNREPPKGFREFPSNTMVEITRYKKEDLDLWKEHRVPQGFLFYIYNWGYYQIEGFTPKNSNPEFLADQVRRFNHFGIRGLYRCGFGELFGLEGCGYYIFGRLLSHPELDPEMLLQEYCQRVFGSAAAEMEKFYRLLYSRQKLNLLSLGETDWSWVRHLKRDLGELEAPLRLLALRYPEPVLAELKRFLQNAQQTASSPAAKWLKPYLEAEFGYLETTAGTANCMNELRLDSDPVTARRMLELVARRNQIIAGLPETSPRLFGTSDPKLLQEGGRIYGKLNFPYWLPAEELLTVDCLPCGRSIKLNAPAQMMIGEKSHSPVSISATVDAENLLVRFHFAAEKSATIGEDKLNFYIEGAEGELYKIQAWLDISKKVYIYLRLKNSVENNGDSEQLQLLRSEKGTLTLKDDSDGKAEAEFSISFALIGGKPAQGTKRKFNASRLRYVPGDNKKQDGLHVWEYNPARLNWRQDLDRYGTLEF